MNYLRINQRRVKEIELPKWVNYFLQIPLSQLDAFLSVLLGNNAVSQTEKMPLFDTKSPIDWLEQLAEIGGVSSIENPVEWQHSIREDRKLLFRCV